jgi:AraC-like DNA-binding protein
MDMWFIDVHNRIMHSFRMVADQGPAGDFAIRVVGWRMPFPEPTRSAAAIGWFCFHFHDPVRLLTGQGEQDAPAETVIVCPVGEPLAHRPRGDRLLRSWVRCDGASVAGVVAAAGIEAHRAYPLARDHEAGDALLALHRACAHRARIPALERDLFQAWLRIIARDASRTPEPLGIEAVRARLEEGFARPQRLDELAHLAGCSRAQLCRRFRTALGCSPIAYVLRLRLEAARELLTTTGLDIAAIAAKCGFSDRYHLTRAFSARYRQGPAAYRRESAQR